MVEITNLRGREGEINLQRAIFKVLIRESKLAKGRSHEEGLYRVEGYLFIPEIEAGAGLRLRCTPNSEKVVKALTELRSEGLADVQLGYEGEIIRAAISDDYRMEMKIREMERQR